MTDGTPIRIPNWRDLKFSLLHQAADSPYIAFLDTCRTKVDQYGEYDWILALAGEGTEWISDFESLEQAEPAWRFGMLSYDLKNKFEPSLSSKLPATIPFPEVGFFKAETLLTRKKGEDFVEIWGKDAEEWAKKAAIEPPKPGIHHFSGFESSFSREEYIETVEQLREHIRQGDCYEINMTQEFSAKLKMERPDGMYRMLTGISPVPFSAFIRHRNQYLICASPERFLQKQGDRLITQPIKGTRGRGKSSEADQALKTELRESIKEQAENVMIVDLSRNDLYRSCRINSVSVPDLFAVQTFPQVHHLVSTVEGHLRSEVSGFQALRNAFPPGSMTGAPKVRVCELIEQYERSARGIYAGSAGYLAPNGDFDFNVVIRSLIYDDSLEKISYHVGGAITYDSDPVEEFEETLVKARAIEKLFSSI